MKWDSLTIHTPIYATDSRGNEVITGYSDVAESGRVRPALAREVSVGRQTMVMNAVGILPTDTAADERCEITAGGRRYRVVGIFPVAGATLSHTHADLEAIS